MLFVSEVRCSMSTAHSSAPCSAPCRPHAGPMQAPCRPHAAPMQAPCRPPVGASRGPVALRPCGARCALCCRQDNPGAASVARELQQAMPAKLRLVHSNDAGAEQLQECTHFLLVLNRRTFVTDTDPTRPGEVLAPCAKRGTLRTLPWETRPWLAGPRRPQ